MAPDRLLVISFLLAPLILVPLAAQILARDGRETTIERIARRLLFFGGVLAAFSFAAAGTAAAILAGTWVLVCLLAAIGGVVRLQRSSRAVEDVCRTMASVFLLIGSAWLLLSRAGVRPFGYSDQTVFLAAVHFHFTGFVLPATASLAFGALRARGRLAHGPLRVISRLVAAFMLAGLPLIAAGNVRGLPAMILAGALLVALASFGLAGLTLSVVPALASTGAGVLLAISALSLTLAMVFAAVYAIGQFTGHAWLLVPAMTRLHGAVTAMGFGVCGLAGWAMGEARTKPGPTASRRPTTSV